MASVLLCSYRNTFFRGALLKEGYEIQERIQPIADDDILFSGFAAEYDYIIFELSDNNPSHLEKIISIVKSPRVICIASKIDEVVKRKLFTLGIIDVLQGIDPDEPAVYLNTLKKTAGEFYGRIIVWDDNIAITKCISLIAQGYGYSIVSVDSISSLFEKMELPTVQCVLINIDSKELRLKDLIMKSYSGGGFKNTPAIIYKDLSAGIFVHEIVSGLNRIANCIVDYSELFVFLAVNLFKKRIIPLYHSFGKQISADNNQIFVKDTLSRIIFTKGSSLFEGDDIFLNNRMSEKSDLLMAMALLNIQSKGFSWLVDEKKTSVSTCGVGGAVLHHHE